MSEDDQVASKAEIRQLLDATMELGMRALESMFQQLRELGEYPSIARVEAEEVRELMGRPFVIYLVTEDETDEKIRPLANEDLGVTRIPKRRKRAK